MCVRFAVFVGGWCLSLMFVYSVDGNVMLMCGVVLAFLCDLVFECDVRLCCVW